VWIIVLAVLAVAGAAAFVALGGLGLLTESDDSVKNVSEPEHEQVESAVLDALRPTYGEEVLGAEISVDARNTVSVKVRTSLAADTELVTRALEIAAITAGLELLRLEWPDSTIVVEVWPSEGDTHIAGAIAKVKGGAFAGPVRPYVEESFRPGTGTP